jgi:hypothetical protein
MFALFSFPCVLSSPSELDWKNAKNIALLFCVNLFYLLKKLLGFILSYAEDIDRIWKK